jgi:hypothetical protein
MNDMDTFVSDLSYDAIELLHSMKNNTMRFFKRNIEIRADLKSVEETAQARIKSLLEQIEDERLKSKELSLKVREFNKHKEDFDQKSKEMARERDAMKRLQAGSIKARLQKGIMTGLTRDELCLSSIRI